MADSMFKMNFTEDDVNSTPKSFEPMPSGEYGLAVTDISLEEVKSGPNAGKPYLKVEFTVQDEGEFNNRKLWANVMLFDLPGGNWFIAQFLKATGNADALRTGNIPNASEFMGALVTASVVRKKDKYKNDNDPKADGSSWYRNDINGFITDEDLVSTQKGRAKKSSVLP